MRLRKQMEALWNAQTQLDSLMSDEIRTLMGKVEELERKVVILNHNIYDLGATIYQFHIKGKDKKSSNSKRKQLNRRNKNERSNK